VRKTRIFVHFAFDGHGMVAEGAIKGGGQLIGDLADGALLGLALAHGGEMWGPGAADNNPPLPDTNLSFGPREYRHGLGRFSLETVFLFSIVFQP
jgi:hypothetical protein